MAFEQEIELAKQLAREAGELALAFQKRGVTAETKSDESPVTAADRACEKLIVEGIARAFPDDGILGEEGANQKGRNGRKWIIDPIDGTRDYVRGIPLWAVLIGLEQDGQVVVGAAHSPQQQLLAWAGKGSGAWVNGVQAHVSTISDPGQAVLSFNGFHKPSVIMTPRLLPWVQRFWAVRGLGGAVDAIFLAQGRTDVWMEPSAHPWDFAALKILIEEAGGRFASLSGENTIYGGDAYACNPGLEPYILELLRT
ncbi:MAG TPA: inositol monophosphatase family protein [Bryobacteraceae bacterium]|nr:inositol monophosphatase family protein [Bryobacteraceae bacterium]